MSGFHLDRRKLLEGMGALGATALIQTVLPIRPARADQLVAGFVYIGPRLDWGWNDSHAVGYITGAEYRWIEMFEGFVETLQGGGTLPNYVIGDMTRTMSARARSERARPPRRSSPQRPQFRR